MPGPPRIAVNQEGLTTIANTVDTIAGEVTASPGGRFLPVQAGYSIIPGEDLEATVASRNTEMTTRLDDIRRESSTQASGIRAYQMMAGNANDASAMTAADVSRIPGWSLGQSQPPTPPPSSAG